VAAEETLLKRLESIASGARLSLARRASGRVAAALLLDAEPRVEQTALENPRLTEAMVRQALLRPESGAGLVRAVCAPQVVAAARNSPRPIAQPANTH